MSKVLEPALTPADAPWGRQVNQRLGGIESDLARLRLQLIDLRESVNGLGSSHATLLNDTVPRRTYRSWAETTSMVAPGPPRGVWTPADLATGPSKRWGEPLMFSLDRRRTVYIEYGTNASLYVQAATSEGAYATLTGEVYVDGFMAVRYTPLGPTSVSAATQGPIGQRTYASGDIRLCLTVDLDEGDHTVEGAVRVEFSPGQGPDASAEASGWDLTVEVGDPAEPWGTGDSSPPPEPGSTD